MHINREIDNAIPELVRVDTSVYTKFPRGIGQFYLHVYVINTAKTVLVH